MLTFADGTCSRDDFHQVNKAGFTLESKQGYKDRELNLKLVLKDCSHKHEKYSNIIMETPMQQMIDVFHRQYHQNRENQSRQDTKNAKEMSSEYIT